MTLLTNASNHSGLPGTLSVLMIGTFLTPEASFIGLIILPIIGIDATAVKEVCEETGTYLSNINTSNQIIIAGKKENLVNAMDLASRLGAKKAIPLPVGGAFHSGLMASAQDELNNVIDEANFEDAVVPIIANTSAEPITEKNLVRNELKNQLQNCVLWSDSIEYE